LAVRFRFEEGADVQGEDRLGASDRLARAFGDADVVLSPKAPVTGVTNRPSDISDACLLDALLRVLVVAGCFFTHNLKACKDGAM
jgi:hypothetical protein